MKYPVLDLVIFIKKIFSVSLIFCILQCIQGNWCVWNVSNYFNFNGSKLKTVVKIMNYFTGNNFISILNKNTNS